MKIEPNDNPHLVIGKLAQENEAQKSTIKILREEQDRLNNALLSAHHDAEALRQQQQRLDDNLQFTKGQLLGCRGANQTLKDKIYNLEMTIDVQTAQLNGHREANKVLEDKNKELEKLLKEEKEAYIRLKSLRHAANYGMGAQQFAEIMLKKSSNEQTATEVLEENNLKIDIKKLVERKYQLITELRHSEQMYKRLANELIAERAAHNKLKALCNERGFGTPLRTPPTAKRKLPSWSVEFSTKYNGNITVLFDDAPSSEQIDKMKERLDATHWTITYNGFVCHE